MTQSTTEKHLDISRTYKVKSTRKKVLLRKLHNILYTLPLLTIHKSFISPHLDYGDIIYNQGYTALFYQKIESVQYNSALVITGAKRGTSKEILYQELGLETLEKRKWYRKLWCFFKIFRNQFPEYLFNIIPTSVRQYNTRNANNIPQFKVKHIFFQDSFFPSVVVEWNKLDQNEKAFDIYTSFWKQCFRWHNHKRIKLLTRLRPSPSHLGEYKFKHGFLDLLNPRYSCGQDTETSTHFFLHCSNYSNKRSTFLNIIRNIDRNILDKNDLKIMETLLYGDSSLDDTNNTLMNATMEFLIASKRFDVPLV